MIAAARRHDHLPMRRLGIAAKITLAVIALVILCVGTMAWVTSQNLQRGFIAYLNALEAQDLDKMRDLLAARYRQRGDFEWLRRNPAAMREVLYGLHVGGDDGRPPRRRPPPRNDDGGVADDRPQQRPPNDPMSIGPRLSISDASGQSLIGPPLRPGDITRAIIVDGRTVGAINMAPIVRYPGVGEGDVAAAFLRGQIHAILLLAAGLMLLAALSAIWLARHLLRPVVALREVTQRIAKGQFDARAPVLGRDELAELAEHVNAMAQALEANQQQQRKLMADMSHELRTPLTIIRGEIEALLDGIRQADMAALESLHSEMLRLNQLVNDLHQLASADAGDLHYRRENVDFTALLEQIVGRYDARAAAAGLRLIRDFPLPATLRNADAGRLTQVLTNLLENSLRYTDAGGCIRLALHAGPDHLELCIDDSAPGVANGEHARLFERLYRVDAARSRECGGSGLGLAICQTLVAAHGGQISASASDFGGVQIRLRLPLAGMVSENPS